eukprot:s462_g22.t1
MASFASPKFCPSLACSASRSCQDFQRGCAFYRQKVLTGLRKSRSTWVHQGQGSTWLGVVAVALRRSRQWHWWRTSRHLSRPRRPMGEERPGTARNLNQPGSRHACGRCARLLDLHASGKVWLPVQPVKSAPWTSETLETSATSMSSSSSLLRELQ